MGFLVGRYGGRIVLACACVVLAVGYGLMAGMQAWWQFALACAVIGFGVAGLGDITVGATVARWVTRSRGLALGIVYTGSNLGGVIATRGGAALADVDTWRMAVAAMAVDVRFRAAARGVVRRARPRRGPGGRRDRRARRSGTSATSMRARRCARAASGSSRSACSASGPTSTRCSQHFVLALIDAGVPAEAASAHLANAVAMGMFSKIAFGWICDRVAPKTALLLDYGLLALSALLLLGVSGASTATIWAFVLLFGFSYAARDLVTPLIIVHCFGSAEPGPDLRPAHADDPARQRGRDLRGLVPRRDRVLRARVRRARGDERRDVRAAVPRARRAARAR